MADEKVIKSDWEHFFKDGTILYSIGRIGYNDGSWYWTLYEAAYYDFIRAYKSGQEDFKKYLTSEGESEEFDDNEEEFKDKLEELRSTCKYVGSANLLKRPVILKKLPEFKKDKTEKSDDTEKVNESYKYQWDLPADKLDDFVKDIKQASMDAFENGLEKLENGVREAEEEVFDKYDIDTWALAYADAIPEDEYEALLNTHEKYADEWGQGISLATDATLEESVEKHETLNPKLWNEDNTLKPEVKEKIDLIVDDFLDGLKEDGIKINVKDVKLVGSNCSYNYNDKSDLDVHIVVDTKTLECPDDLYPLLYSAYRSIWNKKYDIEFYGIPVELFIETEEGVEVQEPTITESQKDQQPLKSNGIYSVKNNKWIKEPVAADIPEVDQEAFDKLFAEWDAKYQEVIAKASNGIEEETPVETTEEIPEIEDTDSEFSYEKALDMEFDSDDMPLSEDRSFKVDIYYKDKDGKPHTARYIDYSSSRRRKEEIVNAGGEVVGMDMSSDDDELNEGALYGLYAWEVDPKTGKKKADGELDPDEALEYGSKEELDEKAKGYAETWNINSTGKVYKFAVRFVGNTSWEE